MPKITYTFHGSPDAKLASLNFEHINNATLVPGTNKGSITIQITNLLDINMIITGEENAEWSMYIEVDDVPLKTPAVDGFIRGQLTKGKTSSISNAYKW